MNEPKVIVSLTSHDLRLKNETVTKVIFQILKGTFKDLKVCLTLYKDDVKLIPPKLKQFIDVGVVELIIADKDLGPHLKYFYAMQKYRNLPVITIDDDILYRDNFVEELMNYHKDYENVIIGRRCFEIDSSMNYMKILNNGLSKISDPSYKNFATGVGGILYPANCLELSDDNLNEILQMKYDDDFYLKALETRLNLKILAIEHGRLRNDIYAKNLNDPITQSIALWNTNWKKSQQNLEHYRKEFTECLTK